MTSPINSLRLSLAKSPRLLTPDEISLVVKEADWEELFDIALCCKNPEPLCDRLGSIINRLEL